jgi:tRNA-dihydrouridine synthase 1
VVGIDHIDPMLSVMLCSQRHPWLSQFHTNLGQCASLDEIEALLNVKVQRWRGMTNISVSQDGVEEGKGPIDEDAGIHRRDLGLSGFLDEDELSGG